MRSATCDNHDKLLHEQAQGLRGSAADRLRGNSIVRRGSQMRADCHASVRLTVWLAMCYGAIATMHAISTALINVLSTLDQGMLRRHHAS
jgi:hypothetical protein